MKNTKFVRNQIVFAVLHVEDSQGQRQKLPIQFKPEWELASSAQTHASVILL